MISNRLKQSQIQNCQLYSKQRHPINEIKLQLWLQLNEGGEVKKRVLFTHNV
jgi:hypothetical protein